MGNIPYESQVDARSGRSRGPRLQNAYNADDFGAATGRAMQQFGQGVQQYANVKLQEREREIEEQALYAEAMFDPTSALDAVRGQVNQDAEGYKETIRTTYTNTVEDYLNGIEDDNVRTSARRRLMSRLPGYTAQAQAYQSRAQMEASKSRTDQVLGKVQNSVLADPASYDLNLEMGLEAIELYGPADGPAKGAMKTQFAYDLARKRFEASISAAKTPQDLDSISAELQEGGWQESLMPRDYEDINNAIVSARRSYSSQINSELKANLSGLEERSKDVTALIPQDEMQATAQTVKQYGDAAAQTKFMKLARRQQMLRSARKLTPTQLAATINEMKSKTAETDSGSVFFPAANAAARFTGVNPNLLLAISGNEYRVGGPEKNPNSTATGPMQFIEGTFLDVVKSNRDLFGIKAETSDADILKLRSDADAAFLAGALYAKQNKSALEQRMGRSVTDGEVYMAHFLGLDGYTQMWQASQVSPQAPAKQFVSAEAYDKNKPRFTNSKTKQDYTVAEFISNHEAMMESTVGGAAFEDIKVLEDVLTAQREAVTNGTILEYAASTGVTMLTPLDQPGAFAARTREVDRTSNYFGVEVKPFTREEEAFLAQKLNSSQMQEQLDVLSNIASMGPRTAAIGLRQLNDKNPAAAQAGRLMLLRDDATAQAIVRGANRVKENPSIVAGVGFKSEASASLFENEVNQAFSRLPSEEREAIKKAADAYYIEALASSGGTFNDSDYRKVIEKVSGYKFARINGFKTAMPKGVSESDMNTFLDKADAADVMAASLSGQRPKAQIGIGSNLRLTTKPVEDILPDARLVLVSGDIYRLYPPSGAVPYTTGELTNGVYQPYDIKLTKDTLDAVRQKSKGKTYASVAPVPKADIR